MSVFTLTGIKKKWNNYWYSENSGYAMFFCRVAIGLMTLTAVTTKGWSWNFNEIINNLTTYSPKGILAFFGSDVPSPMFFKAVQIICIASCISLIVGFYSRVSAFTLAISGLLLIGFFESVDKVGYWGHGFNLDALAIIAFMFANSSQKFSVDNLLNKYAFKKKVDYSDNVYSSRWPVLFLQFVVAACIFNAFFWKMYNSGIWWALSDNLRLLLAVQYPIALGQDFPSYILPIVSNEWMYKGLAAGNFIGQLTPLLACIFIKKPLLRAFFGFWFVLEVLGFGILVGLWNNNWLYLYVPFVDWDKLIKYITKTKDEISDKIIAPKDKVGFEFANIFTVSFLVVFSFFAFNILKPHLDYDLNSYPFSSLSMYSDNRAKKPYSEHLTYERLGLDFEFENLKSDVPLDSIVRKMRYKFSDRFRSVQTLDDCESAMLTIKNSFEYLFPESSCDKIIVYRCFYQIPAYPEIPYPKVILRGLLGEIDSSENINTLGIKYSKSSSNDEPNSIELISNQNLDNSLIKVNYISIDHETQIISKMKQLDGNWEGNKFSYFPNEKRCNYSFFIEVNSKDTKTTYHSFMYGN